MIRLRVLGTLSIEAEPRERVAELAAQPKSLALLAYLVLARPRGFHQRDRLVGLFWPEMNQEQARAALRKALHGIRRSLGEDVVEARGTEAIAISAAAIECDALAFETAVSEGSLREALERYTGELMPGTFIRGASGFEEWIERERAYYRDRAVTVAWNLVERMAADNEATNATQVARLVAQMAGTDERILRKVLLMLSRLGDRAGAVDLYTRFSARLWKELEIQPSSETRRLIESIRLDDGRSG
jgi:serine/threonine-protein kinase